MEDDDKKGDDKVIVNKSDSASSEQDNLDIELKKKDIKTRAKLKETSEALNSALEENESLKLSADKEKKKIMEKTESAMQQAEAFKAKYAMSELKAQAISAGMTDLDFLKMVDTSGVKVDESGNVTGAVEAIESFKKSKPALFGSAQRMSSSHNTGAPSGNSASSNKKDAMKMTNEEWEEEYDKAIRTPSMFNY